MTIDEKIHILQGQINAIKIALGSGGGGELPPDLDARLKQVEQDVAELTLEVAAAQNTADSAQQAATSARSAAATAQDTANAAEALAGTAKAAADNALSAADGAIDIAQEASGKADAAQASAEVAKTAADNAQNNAEAAHNLAAARQARLLYLHKIQINFERVQATTATDRGINFLTGFFTLRSTNPDALSGDDVFDQIIVRNRINPITLIGTAQDQQLFAPFVLYQIERNNISSGILTFAGTYFVGGENVAFRVQCQRSTLDTSRIIDSVIGFEE
ncbi:hypothetical protein [Helicobacter ganmani]|uniref:hypothetical protein n=1 Tax=Helicobacter ganmani TaxID=60246 RepID=UPI003A87BAA2